jgi:hypothetical protein
MQQEVLPMSCITPCTVPLIGGAEAAGRVFAPDAAEHLEPFFIVRAEFSTFSGTKASPR